MKNINSIKNNIYGFILMELILALSIFTIISLPLLKFILLDANYNIWKYIHTFSFINRQEIRSWIDDYDFKSFDQEKFQYLNIRSSKNCDAAFDEIFTKNITASRGVNSTTIQNQITYPVIEYYRATSSLASPFMYPTTIIADIYKDSTGGSKKNILLGTDSSSTTDPDLLALRVGDMKNGALLNPQKYFLGPGVIDMIRDGTDVYAVERSQVQPIWKISLSSLRENLKLEGDAVNLNPIWKFAISSSSIDFAFPKKVNIYKDFLIIATEKNPAPEIYIFPKPSIDSIDLNFANEDVVLKIEVGAGVNDIKIDRDILYIASPKNPEFEMFDLTKFFRAKNAPSLPVSNIPVNSTSTYWFFDAPGSSGNGKVFSFLDNILLLGRTIGNEELLAIRKKDNQFESHGGIDINQSIQKIVPIYGGRYLIVLNKNMQKAIQIFAYNNYTASAGVMDLHRIDLINYQLLQTISMEAIPTDIQCIDKNLFISLQDTRLENRYILASIHF